MPHFAWKGIRYTIFIFLVKQPYRLVSGEANQLVQATPQIKTSRGHKNRLWGLGMSEDTQTEGRAAYWWREPPQHVTLDCHAPGADAFIRGHRSLCLGVTSVYTLFAEPGGENQLFFLLGERANHMNLIQTLGQPFCWQTQNSFDPQGVFVHVFLRRGLRL